MNDFIEKYSFLCVVYHSVDVIRLGDEVGIKVTAFGGVAQEIAPRGVLQHCDLDVALRRRGIGDDAVTKSPRREEDSVCVHPTHKALRLTADQCYRAVEHFAARAEAADVLLCQRDVDARIVGDDGQLGNVPQVGN